MNLSEVRKTTVENHLRPNPTPPHLTEDLVLEIVKRLPLKNAIQCSCLNKSFKTQISAPTFARDHALISSSSSASGGRVTVFHCSADFEGAMIYTVLNSPAPSKPTILKTFVSVVASCNGVLLLRMTRRGSSPDYYFLLNPITGGNMFLDYPVGFHGDVTLAVDFPADHPSSFKLVTADNITCHSVFRFTVLVPSGGGAADMVVKSTVDFHYNNSTTLFTPKSDKNIRPVYANGRLHWITDDATEIVIFDVENETAKIITGPMKEPGFHERVDKWFGFVRGSLHFIHALPEEIVVHTHDYGKDEWTVAHRIKNISERPNNNVLRNGVPVMFDGEHVFFHVRPMGVGGHVWMYDLKSGNWEKTSGKVRDWADWEQNYFAYLPTLANVSYGKDLQSIIDECPLKDENNLRLYNDFKENLLQLQRLLR